MLLHENAANSTLPQFFLLFKPRFIHRWVRSPQIHAQKGWHSIRVMDSCQSLPDDGTAIPCRTTCLLYAWLLEGQLTIGSWSYEWIEFKTCHATTWQYQWYSINCSPSDFLKANHVLGEHMWMNPTYFMIPYPGIPFGLTTCLNTVVGRPVVVWAYHSKFIFQSQVIAEVCNQFWLVVDLPLWKNIKVSWDDYSQYMGK